MRRFKQVDVFTAKPLFGNPVAVVLDADGMSDAAMQQFAQWTNLSETTFVLPATEAGADYRTRIFTPRQELPFAGHPTLGTAHAVIEAGVAVPKNGRLVMQCAVGLIEVTAGDAGLSFKLPHYRYRPAPAPVDLAAAIGGAPLIKGEPQVVDVGPHWVVAEIASADAIRTLKPDLPALADYDTIHNTTGLTVFAEDGDGIIVRSFAPTDGIIEDPVCGSGNGAVAAYRLRDGKIGDGSSYTASQGREIGRDGVITVRVIGTDIHVGGQCVTCVDGSVGV